MAAKAQEILGLITASETYNLKNQNMTLEAGIDAAVATFRIADAAHTPFVMAVGMAMFCAYEGRIAEETRPGTRAAAAERRHQEVLLRRDPSAWRIRATSTR